MRGLRQPSEVGAKVLEAKAGHLHDDGKPLFGDTAGTRFPTVHHYPADAHLLRKIGLRQRRILALAELPQRVNCSHNCAEYQIGTDYAIQK